MQNTTGWLLLIAAVSIIVKRELSNETVNIDTKSKGYVSPPRFCPYTGECGSVKTRVLAYFMQWDVLKMSWRCVVDVFKTSWGHLGNVLKRFLQDVLKMFCRTSWRCLEDIWPRRMYWSWSRLLEDVFWKRMTKANIFVLINTSWRYLEDILKAKRKEVFKKSSRRLHQEKCLLGTFLRETGILKVKIDDIRK